MDTARTFGEATHELASKWGWILVLGIASILIGALAIARPFLGGLAFTAVIGAVFAAQGIIEIVTAFQTRKQGGFGWHLLGGLLGLLAGFLLLFFPLTGLVSLTALLGVVLLVRGVSRSVFAIKAKPNAGWFWYLVSGLLSAALGLLVLSQLRENAVWALGMIVGIDVVFCGVSTSSFALSLRKLNKGLPTRAPLPGVA